MFKRNALAAPFQKAFDAQTKGATTELMQIAYRSGEALWVQAQADRVTVIFKTTFKDEVDVIFGEVFLQEFADARRQPALQNSPQVLFYGDQKDPPVELASVKAQKQQGVGYVTFGKRRSEKNARGPALCSHSLLSLSALPAPL